MNEWHEGQKIVCIEEMGFVTQGLLQGTEPMVGEIVTIKKIVVVRKKPDRRGDSLGFKLVEHELRSKFWPKIVFRPSRFRPLRPDDVELEQRVKRQLEWVLKTPEPVRYLVDIRTGERVLTIDRYSVPRGFPPL